MHFQHFSFHNSIRNLHTVQLSTVVQTMRRPLRVATVVLVFCSIHVCASRLLYIKSTVLIPKYRKYSAYLCLSVYVRLWNKRYKYIPFLLS